MSIVQWLIGRFNVSIWGRKSGMEQPKGNIVLARITSSSGKMHLIMCRVSQAVLHAQTALDNLEYASSVF